MSPDSFTVFLSITLLVGVVVGGLATIHGAIFGAFFIQFVPHWAEDISKSAPWAIYGVFLILLMYVMPTGAAGLINRIVARFKRPVPTVTPSGQSAPAATSASTHPVGGKL